MASSELIAGVARSIINARPVIAVASRRPMKARSIPSCRASTILSSRRIFNASSPSGPTISPIPPTAPSTTGTLR